MPQRKTRLGSLSFLLWCALALQLGTQLALGSIMPSREQLLRRQAGTSSIPQLPVCIPPQLTSVITGQYPPSAVTTVQTGTNCNQYDDPPAQIVSDLESPDGLQD